MKKENKFTKANKGEWSEFYAFIKILSDRKLFAADENLNILNDKFYSVLKVIREEAKAGKKYYDISENEKQVRIYGEDKGLVAVVDSSKIKSHVAEIFSQMKSASKTTFGIIPADELMKDLHCTQVKASSGRKADIVAVIHDSISPVIIELGFSIKSMLGSPSTLLNASGATNFIYRLENISKGKVDGINGFGGSAKLRERAKFIYNEKGSLIFDSLESKGFKKNLQKIDSIFPEILAELLKYYYEGKGAKISELVDLLSKDEQFKKKYDFDKGDYEYKVKSFLVAIALGMTPKKEWDGFTKAHGGYIIVKENGEVVCYHLYNRDEFQDYLYKNTKLDTPSTTRHKFGKAYEENSKLYIKLNLQIRFIK